MPSAVVSEWNSGSLHLHPGFWENAPPVQRGCCKSGSESLVYGITFSIIYSKINSQEKCTVEEIFILYSTVLNR